MNPEITFSPAYTIVPTYECFNRCSYCNFRVEPQTEKWMSSARIVKTLEQIKVERIAEILVLSGEVHPGSKRRAEWFTKIQEVCELALEFGFLPHTNVGPLSRQEMLQLKQTNVSMGLMLEQLTPKLMKTVHKHAPSKQPELRVQQLEQAGELKIPFTTGILLGIGETEQDIKDSLIEIARIHERWGHIQEVILQPHSVGTKQELAFPNFEPQQLPKIIAIAKATLPSGVGIQIPPNLVPDPQFLLDCLTAGATDLGGISPIDEVNPDYPHPTYKYLSAILATGGWELKPRLPVYSKYYDWLPARLQIAIAQKKKQLILAN